MTFSHLWVDDTIPIPKTYSPVWTQARSMYEALIKLELMPFDYMSISCNMKTQIGNSYIAAEDLIRWIEERKSQGHYVPKTITYHNREGKEFRFVVR